MFTPNDLLYQTLTSFAMNQFVVFIHVEMPLSFIPDLLFSKEPPVGGMGFMKRHSVRADLSRMDGVVHLNSAFIGSFVSYINLPLTSSVQTPHSSSRSFSAFSSSNNIKVICRKRKIPTPAGVLIEPEGTRSAGIRNGRLYPHMNNALFCPVRVCVPNGSVPARLLTCN